MVSEKTHLLKMTQLFIFMPVRWLILRANLAKLWYPDMWSNTILDFSVNIYFWRD